MMSRTFLLTISYLAAFASVAQDKAAPADPRRHIEVHIEGTANDTIYLANYYGNKLYYSDTAIADPKGKVVFNKPRGYKGGVYAVVVPGPKYFEIILNEPKLVLSTDKNDLVGKLVVKESKENSIFTEYIRFLNARKGESDAIRSRMEAEEDPIAKARAKAELEDLDKVVKQYQKDLVANNPGTFAADLVHMSLPVELPELRKADGSLDSAAAYYQYRAHFWDHFNLTDDRIVRTPIYANKLEEYLTRVVPQTPDTIAVLVDRLIAKTESSEEVFKYTVHTITHKYETSDIMGMDAMFVHMAQTYYCPQAGKASRAPWMDDEKLEKLCERARKMAPLTLGRKSTNIILTDSTEQNWISLHGLPQEYVVVVFWDPHCGVCKKELPEIYKVYQEKLKGMDVQVYAIAKAVDATLMKDWKKFIRENGLDWVNVGLTQTVYEQAKKDPRLFIPKFTTIESLNYAETYDVYSTPKLFLLDGERKIVGKQLAPEQIEDLVKKLKERKAK
jgi:thiol-disulfide isomerase/thioredoxin